jgi:ribosomal protein S18 acetylase RimI-like enzyme
MIEMGADGDVVSIRPIDRKGLDTIVELYNYSDGYSDGYKYATGITFTVTSDDIELKLNRLETSKNEFFIGIFLNSPDSAAPKLIGVLSGVVLKNSLWIKLIAILPQFRRRGIGRMTIGLMCERCKVTYSIKNVLLSVVEKNKAGVQFWLKLGFYETGRFSKMLFGDSSPYEVIIMNKNL